MCRRISVLSFLAAFLFLNSSAFAAPPVLAVSPTYMEFTAYEGGPNPDPNILSIWRSGGNGPLDWNVIESCSWLTVDPTAGSSKGEVDYVNVTVDTTGLTGGLYNCQLTVDAGTATNSPQFVDVNLIVIGPEIQISQTYFEFTAFEGGANPNDQTLTITNSGGGTLNWQITEDCNWLTAEPNSGSSTGEADDVNLSVDISSLAMDIYNCQLTVSDPNADNSPQMIGVNLIVYDPNALLVPSGCPTIQAAIDVAVDGIIIVVAPGVYTGSGNSDLDFGGKAITVQSIDPEDPCVVAATIIDCNGSSLDPNRGFYFHSGEDLNSVVAGFTITNGFADKGGGICFDNSGATISHCRIIGNATETGKNGGLSTPGGNGGNGGGIYSASSSVVIENCKILNNTTGNGGHAMGSQSPGKGGNGAGIYCGLSSVVTVKGCTIVNNIAGDGGVQYDDGLSGDGGFGGGIYCDSSSSLVISDSNTSGNKTGIGGYGYFWGTVGQSGDGGGIYCVSSTDLEISNCSITNNQTREVATGSWLNRAGHGGGIFCSTAIIDGSSITNNTTGNGRSSIDDVGMAGNGGGIYCNSSLILNSCTIEGNRTGNGGGGADGGSGGTGGGIYCTSGTISDCSITANITGNGGEASSGRGGTGGNGGGVYCGSATISDCIISNNVTGAGGKSMGTNGVSGGHGAGIYGSSTISNCVISNNTTGNGGDTMKIGGSGGSSGSGAGVFCTLSPSATIEFGTITDNVTGSGGYGGPGGSNGGRGTGGGIYARTDTVVSDSIIRDNSPEQLFGQDCNNVSYSDISGGTCSGGTGNIDDDPCFVSGSKGTYYLSQIIAGEVFDSPCVDAGSDMAANLGLNGLTTRTDDGPDAGIVDMGYHYSVDAVSADIDESLNVDLFDFSILGSDWQLCLDPCELYWLEGDINRDLCVDINDLWLLTDSWLVCFVSKAFSPNPSNNETGVDPNVVLAWAVGDGAVSHDVYLGTDANVVAAATHSSDVFMGTVNEPNFDPCALDLGVKYYWRIDEVGPACTAEGGVWNFTTWP